MTSTAIPTGTTTAAVATATAANCGSLLYDIPVQDAACAIAYGSNHTDIMSACCGPADVVAYSDNCGLYCLAEDQTVGDLTQCMLGKGAADGDVFCRGATNATATATGADATTLTSGASVVASGTGGSGGDSKATGTESGSAASGTSSSGAAAGVGAAAAAGLSMGGLGVSVLLFSSVLLGALQL